MDKWVLYVQPNYVHPKPNQTRSFDIPTFKEEINKPTKPGTLTIIQAVSRRKK